MIKKSLCILLALFYTLNLNFINIYANQIDNGIKKVIPSDVATPEVSASSAVLIDMESGTILYSKNQNEVHYPASITKILTALLALEYNKPEDVITFSDNAIFGIDRSSSNIAIDVDEQITMKDALYGIMLMSANEVAMGVAEHIGGSVESFAETMTARAKKAGALNSNFTNPHGLHDKEHYTTAYDMAMIAKEAYKLKEFRDIIATMTYQIEPTNKQPEIRYFANQHYMFKNTSYHYDGCTGGKTGYTDEAQCTLVTFAERDGLKLVSVVMDEIGNAKYTDTINLFDYGFNNFKPHTLYSSGFPNTLPVYTDKMDKTNILGNTDIYVQDQSIHIVIPKNADTDAITPTANIANDLIAPLSANSTIGSLDFYYKNKIIASTKLQNTQSFEYINASKTINNTSTIGPNSIINTISKKEFKFSTPITLITMLAFVFVTLTSYKKALRRKRLRLRYRRRTNKNNASN